VVRAADVPSLTDWGRVETVFRSRRWLSVGVLLVGFAFLYLVYRVTR
jgi:hypothetical protein